MRFTTLYFAKFMDANLEGADFSLSVISECDFRNANLTNCNFTGCQISNTIDIKGANFRGAQFPEKYLQNLREADLTGMVLIRDPSM